ncbi:MAG: hypothetical protein MUF72_10235 [Elainella sp. Prado103]|jgi:hypothetical protein|nr:hypothetical protein [Elainella sp. Prado103]
MSDNYYGLKIGVVAVGNRWRWQVLLPIGVTVTSNQHYLTCEQALSQGKFWINAEGVFSALDLWLFELCNRGEIQQQEYGRLMQSVLHVTRHR